MSRLYPRDIFGALWDSLETTVSAGDVCICQAVLRELERGSDEVYNWAKALDFTCVVSTDELLTVGEIANDHPEWGRGQ